MFVDADVFDMSVAMDCYQVPDITVFYSRVEVFAAVFYSVRQAVLSMPCIMEIGLL